MERENKIPGVTWEDETKMLADILAIAQEKLNRTKNSVQSLANDLNELKEVYDAEDKEGLAQWFNTDARFKQARQELLRAERSRKKPYFGRIDFRDKELKKSECYYIGKAVIAEDAAEPMVIDWRAPIASVYYEKSLGDCTYSVKGEGAFAITLSRKRTYEIEEDCLKDFYDSDVVANDELLTKYLARNKRAVLGEIIATIQQEQNEIIRRKPRHNIIVQGSAGSGKTTVAMHRISYILYNYELEFQPKDFYIIGSNKILLNYITGILPDLDVYGVSQMTMEQLFIRLLYEDWDAHKFTVRTQDKKDSTASFRGSYSWFCDLEDYCRRYEWSYIPREDIVIERTHRRLMSRATIERLIKKFHNLSLLDKQDKLTEHLMAQVENEIYGRYYSYPPEEQKALQKYYQTYFGKREWKGSIFELYDDFLREQNEKGQKTAYPGTAFDLYDLAALAYLYKRIKEVEVIQEASHVVIDEAQDFGMMVYGSLKYCLSKCTYTIMGDVSQNIFFGHGLQDWEELRRLMLPGQFDYFGLLRKSYRNTVEISNFATRILQHGSFPIYPVEPIIRHGEEVRTLSCKRLEELVDEAVGILKGWQEKGFETIAVICRDAGEAKSASNQLGQRIPVREFNADTEEFGRGVMILPIEYSKGLEFDAVLLYNANQENYPWEDGYAKLLYVAATRALHELTVLSLGTVTDLIGAPIPEGRQQQLLTATTKSGREPISREDTRTKREIEMQQAREGQRELELRNQIGPRRIVVHRSTDVPGGGKAIAHAGGKGLPGIGAGNTTTGPQRPEGQSPVPRGAASKSSGRKPAAAEQLPSEFGQMPDSTSLRPAGHGGANMGVRWVMSNKDNVEISSGYGTLRITPIAADSVRISFAREVIPTLGAVPAELKAVPRLTWKCKETRDGVDVTMERLRVHVDKKTGALSFYTARGELLLGENGKFPRQVEKAPKNQTWTYFNWGSGEVLKGRGSSPGEWMDLQATARYISFGRNARLPACLVSNKGYQILVPAGKAVMCCTIPTYGPYLYMEGDSVVDYFFRTAF